MKVPRAEDLDAIFRGSTRWAEHGQTKKFARDGYAPGLPDGHMDLAYLSARLVSFGAPVRNDAGAFVDACKQLRFYTVHGSQSAAEPLAEWVKDLTGRCHLDMHGPLLPGVSDLLGTVAGILDAVARRPELGPKLEAANLRLDFIDVMPPYGVTATLGAQDDSGAVAVMWSYQSPMPKQIDPNRKRPAVIKSTWITTAVFLGYAELWRDSLNRFPAEASAA